MHKTDVIIIGSGVMGGSLAWHLAKRGKKVLVLAGKSAPKVISADKLCEMLPNVIK